MNVSFKKMQVHLAGVSVVIVCASTAYVFGVRPALQAKEQLQQTIVEVEHLRGLAPVLEGEVAALTSGIEAKTKSIQASYPIETQSGQPLIGTVSKLLSARDIELNNLREESDKATGEVTLVLQASSEYANMLHFLSDLRRLDCPGRISGLTLTPLDPLGQRCSARITVKFYPAAILAI